MTTDFLIQLAELKELQSIDLSLHEMNTQLIEIPKQLSQLETKFAEIKAAHEDHHQALKELELLKKQDELDLQTTIEHLKDKEARLYAIKTQKEYQAALTEITDAKNENKAREDRILVHMEQFEDLSKKSTQLDGDFADKEKSFNDETQALKAREAKLHSQATEVESKRPAIAAQIDKLVMRQYMFVQKNYPNALVEVLKGRCTGCHLSVPPQLFNEVLKQQKMQSCPSCHRLLYAIIDEASSPE